MHRPLFQFMGYLQIKLGLCAIVSMQHSRSFTPMSFPGILVVAAQPVVRPSCSEIRLTLSGNGWVCSALTP